MKNQNKKPILGKNYILKRIVCPLLIVLMGIFLLPKTAYLSTINAENIIKLTNKTRQNEKISPVTANQVLTQAAYTKAQDLIKAQIFSHTINNKKFSSWVKEANYEYSFVGENLAIDFASSEGVIKAWLESPTHKKNLLNNKFTEIGVAVLEASFQGENSILVVQIFGTPLSSSQKNLNLTKIKKSENKLSELNIQEENLMNNVRNSSSSSILNNNLEIFPPKKYLEIIRINTVLANNEEKANNNLLNTFIPLATILLLATLSSYFFYQPLHKKITRQ
jgi:hypothetical protein